MLSRLPSEVFLQLTDHLYPSDIATLSSIGALAHLFHYIHDVDQTRNTPYFTPHASISEELLYSARQLDTSRYHLVEVTGMQSLVIAEDKTKFTRRTIVVTSNIDVPLDFYLTIRKKTDNRQKYVLCNFRELILTGEELFDPKSMELCDVGSLRLAYINSCDTQVQLKTTPLENLLISSASSFLYQNVDLMVSPLNQLMVFITEDTPKDLCAAVCKDVVLYNVADLRCCSFAQAQTMSLRSRQKDFRIYHLDIPDVHTLKIYFGQYKPQVMKLTAPNITTLKLDDTSILELCADEEQEFDLLSNPALYKNVTRCCVETWLDGSRVLKHLHLAEKLERLQLCVNQVLDDSLTSSLVFPNLYRLDIARLGGEIIPRFYLPSLIELVITCDTLVSTQPTQWKLSDCFPNLEVLVMDSCSLELVHSLFGGSTLEKLNILKLIYLSLHETDNIVDFNDAKFPRLLKLELDVDINFPGPVRVETLDAPNLEILTVLIHHDDALFNGDPFPHQAIHISNCALVSLMLNCANGLRLVNCPRFQNLYHGGAVPLGDLDCDDSVKHLHTLIYRHQEGAEPIQSVMCSCENTERKMLHTNAHPCPDEFFHDATLIDWIED